MANRRRSSILFLSLILMIITVPSEAIAPVGTISLPSLMINSSLKGKPATKPSCVEFGIPCDGFHVEKKIMKSGDNLSRILRENNVSYYEIYHLTKKAEGIFDIRKFRAGNHYTLMRDAGGKGKATYFIYEKRPNGHVVFDLTKSSVYQLPRGTSTIQFSNNKASNDKARKPSGITTKNSLKTPTKQFAGNHQTDTVVLETIRDDTSSVRGKKAYGISIHGYHITKNTIRRGDDLSGILKSYHVSAKEIHHLSEQAKGIFNLRRMRIGNTYGVITDPDQNNKAVVFVYEKNPMEFVVFDLRDTPMVYSNQKKIHLRKKTFAATIETDLWEAFSHYTFGAQLVRQLEDIFAWTVDFNHLQKNDSIVLVFDEKYIDDKLKGVGKVEAARFIRGDDNQYAFYFEQNNRKGYYDETGKSLKKAFLKSPVKHATITSGFSRRRFHPILKSYKPHKGVDYAAPTGTPVYTVGDGNIHKIGYSRSAGRYIHIRHNGSNETKYFHLSRFADGIHKGSRVFQGDIIGYVGRTGYATGPHLCFRFLKSGKHVNPLSAEFPVDTPVSEFNLSEFNGKVGKLRQKLDQVYTDWFAITQN